jgi:hypothetical protein
MIFTLGISRPRRRAMARTSRMTFSVTRWSPVTATLSSIGAGRFFLLTAQTAYLSNGSFFLWSQEARWRWVALNRYAGEPVSESSF